MPLLAIINFRWAQEFRKQTRGLHGVGAAQSSVWVSSAGEGSAHFLLKAKCVGFASLLCIYYRSCTCSPTSVYEILYWRFFSIIKYYHLCVHVAS